MLRRTIVVLAIAFALPSALAFAVPQTLTGIVTDTMCGKKHMIAGKTDADCTRECMKSKGEWAYGLIVGNKVYRLNADSKALECFAGKQVKVAGEVTGTNIAVKTIASVKN